MQGILSVYKKVELSSDVEHKLNINTDDSKATRVELGKANNRK